MPEQPRRSNYFFLMLSAVTIVTGIWLASIYWAKVPLSRAAPNDAALIGDSFGAVNALFSGLAFAGVVVALIIQAKEYRLAELDRREGLAAQKVISRQQYVSSLTSAIATLTELNRERKLSGKLAVQDTSYMRMVIEQSVLRTTLSEVVKSIQEHDVNEDELLHLEFESDAMDSRNQMASLSRAIIDFADECARHTVVINANDEDANEERHQASAGIRQRADSLVRNSTCGPILQQRVPAFFHALADVLDGPLDEALIDDVARNGNLDFGVKRKRKELYSLSVEATSVLCGTYFDDADETEDA